ncbi:DUF4238 domain-containing protein [Acidovorax delafieldii]|uniref:DUF4238 domain-containing protein n=1 Tax=Acidovorax delafieldii TaxID=47920 RepID=UPI003ED1435D
MSGRKQHFIPQLVQRGFAAGKGKKSTQVYVFPRERPRFITATEGVAAQRDFYSPPSDEETLDDKITHYEGSVLAPAIAALREGEPGPIDSNAAAAVVVHLSVRSAFLRGTFSTATEELLNEMVKALGSEDETRSLLGLDSLSPDSMMVKGIDEELRKVLPEGVGDAEQAFFAKLVHFRGREKFAQIHTDLSNDASGVFAALLARLPEIVDNAHGRALGQSLVPQQRVDRLKAMTWALIEAPHGAHFVLPDCLAVGSKTADFRELEPYALLGDDELSGVVLPVSANKVLVGSTGEPRLDATALNEHFARCSKDFIISSRDDAETQGAAALIGTSVMKFVGDLVNETFAPPSPVDGVRAHDDKRSPSSVLVKFEPPARKSGKAQAVLRNLLSEPELEEGMNLVEYVVVTDNVLQSLINRGLQFNEMAAQSVMLGTCHLVETHGRVQCQLFVPISVVNSIVRGTPAAAGASKLIRHQAGRAVYYSYLTAKVPAEVWSKPAPLLTKEGLRAVQRVASHYFGARLSGVDDSLPQELSDALELWKRTTVACALEIGNARQYLIETNDADKAIPHAWVHAELFLTTTASTCAAFPGRGIRLAEALGACAELSDVPLADWLTLYERDLERYFENREAWREDEDLRLLATHLERLLWGFGVVLFEEGPDKVRMLALDGESLSQVRRALFG